MPASPIPWRWQHNTMPEIWLRCLFIPDFLGQSWFLMKCPGKITVLPGHPFVPFLTWCPEFVPHSYFWRVFSAHLLQYAMHLWPKISSDLSICTKKIAGVLGSTLDPAGGAHESRLSQTSNASCLRRLPLWLKPLALVPYCSAQIMITLDMWFWCISK